MTRLIVERAPRRTRYQLDMAPGLTPAERAGRNTSPGTGDLAVTHSA